MKNKSKDLIFPLGCASAPPVMVFQQMKIGVYTFAKAEKHM